MARISKRTVDAQKPPAKGDRIVWDDELRGFGLRVYASGRRTYVIQYRAKGRTRRFVLGPHGVLTPAAARERADWGVTIQTVAEQSGLRFEPLTDEHYDFAAPEDRWNRPAVEALRRLLEKGSTLRAKLVEMGFH